MLCTRRVSGITFIKDAQNRKIGKIEKIGKIGKIGKPTNSKVIYENKNCLLRSPSWLFQV